MQYHWGQFLKERRISAGFTLRGFSKLINVDPSYWSKLERGIANVPQDPELLDNIKMLLIDRFNRKEELRFWLLYQSYSFCIVTTSCIDKLPLLMSGNKEKDFQKLYELIKNS